MAGANDGSADSSIKEDENEARECFAMFDEDSDGFINKSQLPVLLMSLGSNPTQRKERDDGYLKFKRDKVSCNEFCTYYKSSGNSKKKPGDEMVQGMKVYDELMSTHPGDGNVTRSEPNITSW